jgi:hypothetical protein
MTPGRRPRVVVVGRLPEKMDIAVAVLESHGYEATGVLSEPEALRAIAEQDQLFAVVAGGAVDEAAQDRLRAAAEPKGAVLIAASIGHDDPKVHFTNQVVPKLDDARARSTSRQATGPPSRGPIPGSSDP